MAYLMMLQVATTIQCQAAILRDFKLKRMWKQRTTQHFNVTTSECAWTDSENLNQNRQRSELCALYVKVMELS